MTMLRTTIAVGFLLMAGFVFGQEPAVLPSPVSVVKRLAACDLQFLPPDVRSRLKVEFSTWMIQRPTNLSPRARERWEAEKPVKCPGIAVGQFDGSKTRSYAVLLVRAGNVGAGFKFLVFSRKAGQRSYESTVLDQSERGGTNLFIHNVPIRKLFDVKSRKQFQVNTNEGILLVASGDNEYEANVYFWTSGSYRHEAVDY